MKLRHFKITVLATLVLSACVATSAPGQVGGASGPPTLVSKDAVSQWFPAPMGWAAETKGGTGGQVILVTNLDAKGPGSFRAALEAKGPRIVVFEVGGVIDLGAETLKVAEPYITIAGQTAPSPGITLIRGGIDITAHDVIVQHIRVRPGAAGGSWRKGPDVASIATVCAYKVAVALC